MDIPPVRRRRRNYWEPFYEPSDAAPFPLITWRPDDRSKEHGTLTAEALEEEIKGGLRPIFSRIAFVDCDFSGSFARKGTVFKNCTFERCDFGLSTWRFAKFTSCKFVATSFSQSTLERCEFRDCGWQRIGLSGNETVLDYTVITNPVEFIRAAYTNLDKSILNSNQTTSSYQKMRLELTKATVSFSLLRGISEAGDEDSYYNAVHIYLIQSTTAKIERARYEGQLKSGLVRKSIWIARSWIYRFERLVFALAGSINKWGGSIARPAFIGVTTILLFSFCYWMFGIRKNMLDALITGVEITLLVGYTKQSTLQDAHPVQLIFIANMIVGLAWYAVFVPTIINRISRVR